MLSAFSLTLNKNYLNLKIQYNAIASPASAYGRIARGVGGNGRKGKGVGKGEGEAEKRNISMVKSYLPTRMERVLKDKNRSRI